MFAALYQDTKKEEYLELAKEGLTYAMNIAVGDETGRLIPYQDHPVTGPTYDKYYLSTCHGPVGNVVSFSKSIIDRSSSFQNFPLFGAGRAS